MTITTAGYGDRYPVTNAGRAVAVLVMIAGVGLFDTLSGFLVKGFLSPPAPKIVEAPAAEPAPTDAKARIAELKQMLEAHERDNAGLRAKLAEIEALL